MKTPARACVIMLCLAGNQFTLGQQPNPPPEPPQTRVWGPYGPDADQHTAAGYGRDGYINPEFQNPPRTEWPYGSSSRDEDLHNPASVFPAETDSPRHAYLLERLASLPVLGEIELTRAHQALVSQPIPNPTLQPENPAYQHELFFPALLFAQRTGHVTGPQKQLLKQYTENRASLLDELDERLETLRPENPATRERELRSLAIRQAQALSELEKLADELRAGFGKAETSELGSGFWRTTWFRNETLPGKPAQARFYFAEALFQKDFSPDQRRLLLELAAELQDEKPLITSAAAVVPFSPAGARFRLPPNVPPSLQTKITTYVAEKTALKNELRAAIEANRSALFERSRVRRNAELATKQQNQFAQLEGDAEIIRRELAELPPPKLPAGFEGQLLRYIADKAALRARTLDRLASIKAELPSGWVQFERAGESYLLRTSSTHSLLNKETAQRSEVIASLGDFNRQQQQLYSSLKAQKAELIAQLNQLPDWQTPGKESESFEQLEAYFSGIGARQPAKAELQYRTALLEPGLSPNQRRLLVGAALQDPIRPVAE